jgi:dGTPase
VLTRLEAKIVHPDGRPAGLNLTRATLDAATKYPWARNDLPAGAKFGVYEDDADVFAWMRTGAPDRTPCLEAQVMDFADDVAYSVHDVEDGIQAGHIDLAALPAGAEREAVVRLAHSRYAPDTSTAALDAAYRRLLGLPVWPTSYDGTRAALAALKALTSGLIGRFCSAVEAATRERSGLGPLTRYSADLTVPADTRAEIAVLKAVAGVFVMFTEDRRDILRTERDAIRAIADHLLLRAPEALDRAFRDDWNRAANDPARHRVVADQVASLTDASATTLARRLE